MMVTQITLYIIMNLMKSDSFIWDTWIHALGNRWWTLNQIVEMSVRSAGKITRRLCKKVKWRRKSLLGLIVRPRTVSWFHASIFFTIMSELSANWLCSNAFVHWWPFDRVLEKTSTTWELLGATLWHMKQVPRPCATFSPTRTGIFEWENNKSEPVAVPFSLCGHRVHDAVNRNGKPVTICSSSH
jgi:hypothetical protein